MSAFSQKATAWLSSTGMVLNVISAEATTPLALPAAPPFLAPPLFAAPPSLAASFALAFYSFFLSLLSSFFDNFFSPSSALAAASGASLPFFYSLVFIKSF